MNYEERYSAYQQAIEAYLESIFSAEDKPYGRLQESIRYSLLAGGKRIRPVLTLEFARLGGIDWHLALPYACALELVHNYSLIHDDLPCMDNDDYRRGKPTNHRVYGEATACLAGDALLTDAFGVLASAKLPAQSVVFATSLLAENAGSFGMVGGQILDMQSENRKCTQQEVLDIQSRKTGALLNAACALGVLAGGGTEAQLEAACSFAGLLGLAFQIRDDILDVVGDAKTLGKATGTDGVKNTFVHLYGLARCEEMVRDYTERAIGFLTPFPEHGFLESLARSLTDRQK